MKRERERERRKRFRLIRLKTFQAIYLTKWLTPKFTNHQTNTKQTIRSI